MHPGPSGALLRVDHFNDVGGQTKSCKNRRRKRSRSAKS